MRPTRALLTMAFVCFAAPAWAAPLTVALLPSVGNAKEDVRRDLDGALRQALQEEDRIDLLSPVETRQHVMSLAEMGMVCLPEDIGCLVKLGIDANVAVLLVPSAQKTSGKELDVEIVVIDVAASKRTRTVKAHFAPDAEAAAAALVKEALSLPEKAGPAKPPDGDGKGDGHKVVEVPPETPSNKPVNVGAIVTGVSGGLGVLTLAGAITCDLIYSDDIKIHDHVAREKVIQPIGATLWITTVLAAAGVATGVYLLTTAAPADGSPPPPPGL